MPPSADKLDAQQQGLKLRVAVESIQKGTIADFKNVKLNGVQRRSTPYYVTVRITALGKLRRPATRTRPSRSTRSTTVGQQQTSVTFLGTFPRCNDNSVPASFANGRSYTSCLTYLMPGGSSILRMQWGDGPHAANQVTPYFDHPIVWGAS